MMVVILLKRMEMEKMTFLCRLITLYTNRLSLRVHNELSDMYEHIIDEITFKYIFGLNC